MSLIIRTFAHKQQANNKMARQTQEYQVIQALSELGGWATLRKLNETVDFSSWGTKTPEATVRRIVQLSKSIFRIRPGLWALEACRDQALRELNLTPGNRHSEEQFTHGYYQGLLVEIGKIRGKKTYIPAQDKRRLFLGRELGDVADTTSISPFTYDFILRKAKTVDVIWFNEREMPSHFYEVEHTTDIKNSLSKFYELQDFFSGFYIVADQFRENEFNDKLQASIFKDISRRVKFLDYEHVVGLYTNLKAQQDYVWE